MRLSKIAIALAMAGLITGGGAAAYAYEVAHGAAAATPAAATARPLALPDFSTIAQQYGPAVVNISTEGTVKAQGPEGQNPFADDPFFRFFHGLPHPLPRGDVPMHGQGSGFVVSPDGLILTNAHVVRDASEVTVKLTDRREFRAKVLGADPRTDVAVIRIDAKNLPTVKLGDPRSVQVGDWVVAIGSPFGFENSVTSGIVSAKGRSLPGDGYVPFIQTDVAVNPGNSGGPLFNMNGEVVGINSQIYSQTGGYQGLSFAIPIDVANGVKDQIVATGHVTHAQLGVTAQELNQALAESFGLKKPAGALVSSVAPGSPAAKAGIETGDVILGYNGKPVAGSGDLPALVGQAKPGDRVALEVWRKGATRDLNATLGAFTDTQTAASAATGASPQGRLGLAVRPLDGAERQEAGVPGGVVVEGVRGPAAQAGIRPGDIVLSLNGTPVKSAGELRDLAGKSSGNVALLIQRGDARIFVPVHVG